MLLGRIEPIKGLSFSIFVITKPVVPSGSFLVLISSSVKTFTVIFKSSISEFLGVVFFVTLKSSDVSSLPSLTFFEISLILLILYFVLF